MCSLEQRLCQGRSKVLRDKSEIQRYGASVARFRAEHTDRIRRGRRERELSRERCESNYSVAAKKVYYANRGARVNVNPRSVYLDARVIAPRARLTLQKAVQRARRGDKRARNASSLIYV